MQKDINFKEERTRSLFDKRTSKIYNTVKTLPYKKGNKLSNQDIQVFNVIFLFRVLTYSLLKISLYQ